VYVKCIIIAHTPLLYWCIVFGVAAQSSTDVISAKTAATYPDRDAAGNN
jgi:hypothetical protein